MNFEEMIALASSKSDHQSRVTEFLPALQDAVKETPSDSVFCEVGNREGGSGLLILWHITQSARRQFITCDVSLPASLILRYAGEWNIPYLHYQMSQEEFVRDHAGKYRFGFIYLDADHNRDSVVRDIRRLSEFLVLNARMAVDDVHGWVDIPRFDDVGLERVEYEVDQGDVHSSPTKTHILFLKKI